jgi:inner membrane protein
MDNLAHSLVGLSAAKAGLERLSPGATTVCILAANAPDIDFLSAFSGDRWTVLHYHRGISHSLVGTFVLALIIPTIFYLGDLAVSRVRRRPASLRFFGLLLASLIAAATHPLLDWTNNYGVRPLLPWSGKWFYGDLVFVVDPVLWLLFGSAAFLLTAKSKGRIRLWALLGTVLTALFVYAGAIDGRLDHGVLVLSIWIVALVALIGGYRLDLGRRFGPKLAAGAFLVLLAYWCGLGWLRSRALVLAGSQAVAITARSDERLVRMAAMPTLANPTHWLCIAETDRATYRFDVLLVHPDRGALNVVRFSKLDPADSRVIELAADDRRARLFFEFARFPVARLVDGDCGPHSLVQLADLRYTEPGKSRGSFALELTVPCSDQRLGTSDGRQ